jgi:hypothetical protein
MIQIDCTAPATGSIEVYSPKDGRAHGQLDARVYTCNAHTAAAIAAIEAAGQTAWHEAVAGQTCGYVFDYTTMRGAR